MEARKRRWPSEAEIVVERGESAVRAKVDDVSAGGLKIRSQRLDAKPGDLITIRAGKMRAAGEVRWVRKTAFGLSFRPQLQPDMLGHLTGGLYRPDAEQRGGRSGWGKPGVGHLSTM